MTHLLDSVLKKCLAVTVTSIMIFSASCSFAMGHVMEYPSISAMMTDDAIDAVVDTENVDEDLKESKKGFHSEGDSIDIDIPKDPEGKIRMDSEDIGSVSMKLPEEVPCEKAEMVDGTVMFDSSEEDVTVAVQTEKCEGDEAAGNMVRSMVIIDSAKAPKEYTFGFALKKGQSLKYEKDVPEKYVSDESADRQTDESADKQTDESADKQNPAGKGRGKIYVVEDNEPLCEIQPAWAKDADGEPVDTHYEIRGNDLVQVVSFDENTRFPVVADPAMSGYYYRKKGVSIKNKYGKWKRTSSIMNTYGTQGGTLHTNAAFTISGSVSGGIKGITTIGVGASFSSAIGKTWKIDKNKRCYLVCRAEYKVEKGTREKVNMNTRKVVERNRYTVKRPRGKIFREYKVRNI